MQASVALPVVFLMGPTAAGKTQLAVELAARFPCDIVSVDSVMVYRGLDIGTGKPSQEIQRQAPHRLIDIREPDQTYSAADFRDDATKAIQSIHSAGRIPLLTGGTLLYFRALRDGLAVLPAADAQVRARLEEQADCLGWGALHERLSRVDPQSAERIHRNDAQRIQRALEVYEVQGRPMSEFLAQADASHLENPVIGISIEPSDRAQLHRCIEERFLGMVAAGLVDEVRELRRNTLLHAELPAMRAVGYRQVWSYLEGNSRRDDMIQQAIAATRQLARRQLTWLRGESELSRFDCFDSAVVENVVHTVGALLDAHSRTPS